MNQRTRNIVRALLDGLTGAGLFRRLRYPGAPTHMIDPRSVEEILACDGLGEKLTHKLREYEEQKRHRNPSAKDGKQTGGQA
jgi:hypothetical protein